MSTKEEGKKFERHASSDSKFDVCKAPVESAKVSPSNRDRTSDLEMTLSSYSLTLFQLSYRGL
jgi:hypothetical protein